MEQAGAADLVGAARGGERDAGACTGFDRDLALDDGAADDLRAREEILGGEIVGRGRAVGEAQRDRLAGGEMNRGRGVAIARHVDDGGREHRGRRGRGGGDRQSGQSEAGNHGNLLRVPVAGKATSKSVRVQIC